MFFNNIKQSYKNTIENPSEVKLQNRRFNLISIKNITYLNIKCF